MISQISSFDEENKDDKNENLASDYCFHIVNFLWGICQNEIIIISFDIDRDDEDIKIWNMERHKNCLLPVETPSSSILNSDSSSFFNELDLNVQQQTKVMESICLDNAESRSIQKLKFENLHDLFQRLILNASSLNRESILDSPVTTALNISK